MRRFAPLLVLALTSSVFAAAPALQDGHGIHVETVQELDARQLAVHVSTDALQHPVDIRILLPARYDATPGRRYPVLYLFHGTSGRASDWVDMGDAVATTATLPLIVVMPDAGFDGDGGGWFTNWFNGGAGGQPMWETFHVEEVIPWIDDNLRTKADARGRAIAGLSQGGFGALSYAARHPDLFTSVAAFSGGCVIDGDPQAIAYATAIIQFTTTALDGVADPDAIFGPRATEELNWQGHDPGTLVTNLRGKQIEVWTGDGTPGPLDPNPIDSGASSIEMITFGATMLFDGYLTEVGIRHGYHYYGGGTHIFPYWARDLREYVGPLMKRFRHPPRPPKSVDYRSIDGSWAQWGWQVALTRPEPAFSALSAASRKGFSLDGTGTATVQTPGFYRRGSRVRVVQRGSTGQSDGEATVDTDGHVQIEVPLSGDTTPGTTRVKIRPLGS